MSTSPIRKSAARDEHLDRIFGALSDRTRRGILARLSRGPANVSELAAPFDMSLPAVSRHLKVLEGAQLIERSIDGRVHQCSLGVAPLRDVQQWLDHYRAFWEGTLDALARYAESKPPRADRASTPRRRAR